VERDGKMIRIDNRNQYLIIIFIKTHLPKLQWAGRRDLGGIMEEGDGLLILA
jgi:hypothetical protein